MYILEHYTKCYFTGLHPVPFIVVTIAIPYPYPTKYFTAYTPDLLSIPTRVTDFFILLHTPAVSPLCPYPNHLSLYPYHFLSLGLIFYQITWHHMQEDSNFQMSCLFSSISASCFKSEKQTPSTVLSTFH
jgi:hypothetical protein